MEPSKNDRMISFHIPTDQALLAAVGRVAICHGHLDHILKMTIKSITGVSIGEALDAAAFESSSSLRRRVTRLAKQKLEEGTALVKLQALIERARRATEKRNKYIHSLWAQELDGDAKMRDATNEWEPIPTVETLEELASDIIAITSEINVARLEGWLLDALTGRPKTRPVIKRRRAQ